MKPIRGVAHGAKRIQLEQRTDMTGRTFSAKDDDKIDRTVHLALNNPAGRELMNYLEGITMRTVLPVDATNEQLRDMEAQRRLVAMLKARMKRTADER